MRLLFGVVLGLILQTMPLPGLAASGPQVINMGYPGFNSAELDAKFDSALQATRPRYVVLMAGANDALNDKKFLSPEETRTHIQAMVQRAQTAGATVLLVTTHDPDLKRLLQRHRPEDYGASPPLVRLARVNAMIAEIAARKGAILVDFHSTFAKAGGANADLSTDGVHLTAKGYGVLARAVRARLPKDISAQSTILCFGDSLTYGQGVRGAEERETPFTYPSQLRALLLK